MERQKETLFYSNDFEGVRSAPDPFILFDDGYFYLYSTEIKNGILKGYRSRDFAHWEDLGVIYERDESYWASGRFWAPRVLKYPKDGKYYLYCACSGDGVIGLPEGTNLEKGTPLYASVIMDRLHLTVLVADHPAGPFREWTGKRNLEKFYHGESLGVSDDEVTLTSGPMFDFANAPAGWETNRAHFERNGTNIFAQLDPCPFLDDDGTLYLYFVRSRDLNDNVGKHGCWGIKMLDPVTPDYRTLSWLTQPGYYTVGGEPSPITIDDEIINEGVFMQKHTTVRPNGESVTKYYLTYTRCGMGCAYYSACLALADAPLGYAKGSKEAKNGGFKKVPPQYGNPIHYIEAINDYGTHFSSAPSYDLFEATGNAVFFSAGEENFLVSLCTVKIPEKKSRNFVVDRWTWKYNEQLRLDIPHSNGPTQASLQPCPFVATGYKNIAGRAVASVDRGEKTERLNNGFVALHPRDDSEVFYAEGKFSVTLSFGTAHAVRAILVYNTWDKSRAFKKIDKIVLKNGEDVSCKKDIPFPQEYLTADGALRPGGAAIWEFEEQQVKEITLRFSENMQKNANGIGIADIVVLGR